MADCLWPNRKRQQALVQAIEVSKQPDGATGRAQALLAVSARLDAAMDVLCKKFNIHPIEIDPSSHVLAEIMRQLYGQQWLDKDFGK
jgi:hypothetical protein